MTRISTCPVCDTLRAGAEQLRCADCGFRFHRPDDPRRHEPAKASLANADDGTTAAESDPELETWRAHLREIAAHAEPGRRHAAMVFVDLVDYTKLVASLPAAELHSLRRWFSEVCAREIERHGGFPLQFVGDAVFASFGAPRAFERDAEAAVACMLKIARIVERHRAPMGHRFRIHAGAAFGEVGLDMMDEFGRSRPDLYGNAVNVASRLHEAAEPGVILLSRELADAVSHRFEVRYRSPIALRNVDGLVEIAEVVGEKTSQLDGGRHEAPFVGRKRELAAIESRISAARTRGFSLFVISGPPGIGKSKLLSQASAEFPPGFLALRVRTQPYLRHTALSPFQPLLSRMRRCCDGGFADRVPGDAWTAVANSLEPELRSALATLEAGDTRAIPPNAFRQVAEMVVIELLARFAQRSDGMLLAVDDAQWLDPTTSSILGTLCRKVIPGIAVVVCGRPTSPSSPASPYWARWESALAPSDGIVVELDPLSDDESEALLGQVVDVSTMHPTLHRRILERAGGNPLYIVELAKAAVVGTDAVGALLADSSEGRFVGSALREISQARVDLLSATDRRMLQRLAVLGQSSSRAILRACIEEEPEATAALDSLVREGCILLDADGWRFDPPHLRDIAYRSMDDGTRRNLHASTARAIERRRDIPSDDRLVLVARQKLQSGQSREAIGQLSRAVQSAMRRGMAEESCALATEALELVSASSADGVVLHQRVHLRLLRARALRMLGAVESALTDCGAAAEEATGIDDPYWLSCALMEQAVGLFELGRLAEADRLLDKLAASPSGHDQLDRRVALNRAHIEFRRGTYAKACESYLEIATSYPELAGDALSSASVCMQRIGRIDAALATLRRAAVEFDARGSMHGRCVVMNNLSVVLEKRGALSEARRVCRQAMDLARNCGFLHAVAALAGNLANLAFLLRDADDAVAQASTSLRFARMIGHAHSEVVALVNLALGKCLSGRVAEAKAIIDESIRLAMRTGDLEMLGEATVESAWIALATGDRSEAGNILSGISEKLSADASALRDTLSAMLAALAGEQVEADFWLGDPTRHTGLSCTARLRRIEAGILLSKHSAIPIPQCDLEAARLSLAVPDQQHGEQ